MSRNIRLFGVKSKKSERKAPKPRPGKGITQKRREAWGCKEGGGVL